MFRYRADTPASAPQKCDAKRKIRRYCAHDLVSFCGKNVKTMWFGKYIFEDCQALTVPWIPYPRESANTVLRVKSAKKMFWGKTQGCELSYYSVHGPLKNSVLHVSERPSNSSEAPILRTARALRFKMITVVLCCSGTHLRAQQPCHHSIWAWESVKA